MKNAILTGASVLALSMAAPAFAQTAPTAPATPSAAPGTPECAGTTNNCSLIDQAGTDLSATVTQSGSGNVSDIDQEAGSIEAEATVTQKGTDASSYILQSDAGIAGYPTRATVTQSGQGSESVILQTETRNHNAVVTQDGASSSFIAQNGGLDTTAEVAQSGGSDNTAIVFQQSGNVATVGDGNPNNLNGGIIQTGSENNAEIYQGSFDGGPNGATGTRATTTQTGVGNDSIIIQNMPGQNFGGTNGQRVNVTQTGDDNISSVVQTGIRDAQTVDIIQTGNDNLSRVEQSDPFNSSLGNDVDVQQTGNENASFVDQTSSTAVASLTQNGSFNDSIIDQTGGTTSATVIQTASGLVSGAPRSDQPDPLGLDAAVRSNFSRVIQNGLGTNNAMVTQTGTGNRSEVEQMANAGTASAELEQQGTFNNSAIRQTAAASTEVFQGGTYGDNYSFVDQTADGAHATVNQFGNTTTNGPSFPTNESTIFQADAATADVMQTGSQNRSDVDQQAGAVSAIAKVDQQTDPAAIGSGDALNDSMITQSATTSAFVQQIGQGNSSDVDQSGENATPDNGFTYAVEVQQLGQSGTSTVIQTGLGNEARLIQTAGSELNESLISQGGNDNLAEVLQAGVSNLSEVYQSGNNNTADVSQYSNNNSSFVDQSGNGNTATVVQGTM
ncbi:hypothetical protein P8Q88_09065 [Qipengyuania sp. XHP0207]|uniref:hypothetical protein n=1 Tax=Qipengyuania sp. XHP0207 TaxID=3038078 RepID=UPI00241D7B87|nr:hypothetical protein [Qipengyuania sp. XHP0207]MDG5748332.1 hypothetical protein [Qipengyuania sp. XHP0207]